MLHLHKYNCILKQDESCHCNEVLHSQTSVKYLGVIIDNNLKFTDHISNLNKKLMKLNYKFYQIRNTMPVYILRLLYILCIGGIDTALRNTYLGFFISI